MSASNCKTKITGAFIISVLVVSYYKMFIFSAIPPQYGWWNYYGWQMASGSVLYKDIYCYLPPGFPLLCMALYELFGDNIVYYYYLGVGLSAVTSALVYWMLCRIVAPVYSFVATLVGTLVTCGFLAHLPYDYNPVLQFIIVSAAFLLTNLDDKKTWKGIFVGVLFGLSVLIKQTSLVYVGCLLIVWFIFVRKTYSSRCVAENVFFVFLGALVVAIPSLYYLYSNEILHLAWQEITHASAAKGMSVGFAESLMMLLRRFYTSGFSFTVLLLSGLLMLKYCTINSKREIWDKLKLNEVINYLVFSLILFKILRNIQILSNDNVKLFYVAVFANLIFGTIFLLRKIDIPYVSCDFLRDGFRRLEYKKWYTYFIGLGILGLMILIQNTGFPLREEIYSYGQGGILWLMKRSISDVAFWWSAFWCLWCLFKKNIDEKEKSIFVFIIANILFQSMILAGSGSLDEAFSLTTVSFAMACLVRSRKFKNYIYLFCITVFVIFASITQKQVMAYNWHGWIAMGPDNTGVTYVESKVPGLQGFELDRDTELAYENITSAINVYSLPSDNVYEFPHSPLFNVLCHRKLGTFAVSHFFDVCPDDVFREDFEKIKVNDPKIFIWVELEDSVWLTHEKYYRNGQTLAAREMIPYYEKYIRKAYQQVYRFKNIHVWVKNPTNEQNLEFAKIRLRNSLDLLDDKRFSQMDLDTAADKAMHTMQDGMHYSVSACMNKIIMADDVLYSSLHDADYQFVFHELREWEQKKNN